MCYSNSMNERYTKLADSTEVNDKIVEIAAKIATDHATPPVFVGLLRGAAPFSSKLMHALARQDLQPELDYMMVSTYGSGQQAGEPHIVTDLAPSTAVHDRSVVVIDDVLDQGVTANFVFNHLRNRGATALKLAVLCEKDVDRELPIVADYKGFTFGDKWLVGMGMDDASAGKEGYRWLEEIWEVKQD